MPLTTVKAPPLILKLRAYWNIGGGPRQLKDFETSGFDVTLLCSMLISFVQCFAVGVMTQAEFELR